MDYTSTLQDYQIPINAFKGFYQVEPEKNWSVNYIPLRNWYNPLKTKILKYHFLGDIISKLDLINLIIFYWPYRSQIEYFDLKIMPWLRILSQDRYRFVWSKECYKIETMMLRDYLQIEQDNAKAKITKNS
jgi:hypothetical protein